MRKYISVLLMAILITSIFVTSNQIIVDAATQAVNQIKTSDQGLLTVAYKSTTKSDKPLRVLVEKGDQRYTYVLPVDQEESFPLQLGNGTYNISILEHVEGQRYRYLQKDTVDVKITDEKLVFLQSVQNVKWNNEMKAIQKAKELTKQAATDEEKVQLIYNYIISTVKYDFDKAKNVKTGYIPNIDNIFEEQTGICYDYAALFAGMLRAVDVPAKLVTGYTTYVKDYHAWNQVYIKEQNKWVTIDTTVDASLKAGKKAFDMVKNTKDYSQSKVY